MWRYPGDFKKVLQVKFSLSKLGKARVWDDVLKVKKEVQD